MATPAPGRQFKKPQHLRRLKRSALHSYFREKVDDLAGTTKFPKLKAFLPQNFWPWMTSYLQYAFHKKHPFLDYGTSGDRGLYTIGPSATFSIAGDWGTGTKEANDVASAMDKFGPDYTIHLGDVYFVGDDGEVKENFFGQQAGIYSGVNWPRGAIGSFALSGNHEMYANGNAYFKLLLPALGIPTSQDKQQLTSFFCLENDIWRVLGVDTGYNSIGVPVLSRIPLINKLPGIGPDCKLEDALIRWLRDVVKPDKRPRATILLTHHQDFSAFEDAFPKPGKQLMEFFSGQDLIWLWGHEHRMAVYGKYSKHGLTAYCRCIGHGGLPVELDPVNNCEVPLQYHDTRVYATYDGTAVGMNGFVNLTMQNDTITLEYRDLNNHSVLRERFTAKGTFVCQSFEFVDPALSKGVAAPPMADAQHA